MALPWKVIESVATQDGVLELRQRGERDFLIMINGRVLMNSSENRSETELGRLACERIAGRPGPRVLIGGLGMGLTLRAAVDTLPASARIVVAELNPVVLRWCREALGALNGQAVSDPRVSIHIGDVADAIAGASAARDSRFDAIIIDLYEGPGSGTDALADPFYGRQALKRTADALTEGGVFAVWGEAPDAGFESRMQAGGFRFDRLRPGRGGRRHVVYLGTRTASGQERPR
jgi:spermidine synthase